MKNLTKALTLTLSIFWLTTTVALASITYYADGSKWDRGSQQGNPGWYMAHSYYNQPAHYHSAYSSLDGQSQDGMVTRPAGTNACSNSVSSQSKNYYNSVNDNYTGWFDCETGTDIVQ